MENANAKRINRILHWKSSGAGAGKNSASVGGTPSSSKMNDVRDGAGSAISVGAVTRLESGGDINEKLMTINEGVAPVVVPAQMQHLQNSCTYSGRYVCTRSVACNRRRHLTNVMAVARTVLGAV